MKLRRRALLQWLGIGSLGAAAPLAPRVEARAAPPARPARPEAGFNFFTAQDAAFITAAVDRLLPADDWPSASQAGVVVYIDRQLAGPYGRGARMYMQGPHAIGTPQQGYQMPFTPAQLYRRALDGLAPHLGGRALAERSPDEQDAFLKRLEAGELMLGEIPSAVFFETLLANTIEGYFADPMYGGNRDMAGWRMIGFPGAHAMYVQWVDKHGIKFDRPPIGIAQHGGHAHGR
jgi:gluconate 2-dehydrogenase gamma chain